MSGHRLHNSGGSVFSLDGLRSLSRAATPSALQRSTTPSALQRSTTDSVLQRSAMDTVIGIPYNETKPASRELRKPEKLAPTTDSVLQCSAMDTVIGIPYNETKPASRQLRKPEKLALTTDSVLRRSATDTVIGIPYNETKPATDMAMGIPYYETKQPSQEMREPEKPAPVSLGMRLRSAAGKATAKLKSLGKRKPIKALEKMPEKTYEEESAVPLSRYPKQSHVQDHEDVTALRQTKSTPTILPPQQTSLPLPTQHAQRSRINPLGCHPDVMAFTERPVFTTPPVPRTPVPRINIIRDAEFGDDNDSYRNSLRDVVIYSPSLGDFNSYARKTPSPARTSYDSPLSINTDEDDLSVGLITPTRAPIRSDRSRDFAGMTRSTAGLSIRDSMSGLLNKPTGYSQLSEPREKSFEKLGSRKAMLTPIKEYQSSTTLDTPQYSSEKTLLAEESVHHHTPKNPSPLRRVYSSESLGSLEHEQLKMVV